MSEQELLPRMNVNLSMDLGPQIPEGVTLESCEVFAECTSKPGTDASAILPDGGDADCDGTVATIRVEYGEPGQDYRLIFVGTTSDDLNPAAELFVRMKP